MSARTTKRAVRGYVARDMIPVSAGTPLTLAKARERSTGTANREKPSKSEASESHLSPFALAKLARGRQAKVRAAAKAEHERALIALADAPPIIRRQVSSGPNASVPEPDGGWRRLVVETIKAHGSVRKLHRAESWSERAIERWRDGESTPTGDRARRLIELGGAGA